MNGKKIEEAFLEFCKKDINELTNEEIDFLIKIKNGDKK